MTKRVLFDNTFGVKTYVDISDDGDFATISHDVDSDFLKAQLDLNKARRLELDGRLIGTKRGMSAVDAKCIAFIPDFVCWYWRDALGVDVLSPDPDMKAKVSALLDDSDWSALKTTEGKIGKTTKWQ